MPKGMQAIYTQTASGSSNTITFDNIPQTFTDLKIVASIRTVASATHFDYVYATINDSYSTGFLSEFYSVGNGTGGSSTSGARSLRLGYANASSSLSSTNAVSSLYIPNYARTMFKTGILFSVQENSTAGNAVITMSTVGADVLAPIRKISFTPNSGANFTSTSTFTLYGIAR